MRISRLGAGVAVTCLLSAGAALASGAPRAQWKLGEFTWVKRVAAESPASVNAHPAQVSLEALRQFLGGVGFLEEGREEPLFFKEELPPLLEALREAFAQAGPNEDLLLLSTHKRGGSFLNPPKGLTARLFIQGGELNLIVHDARLDFMDRYRGSQILPDFKFGSRKDPSPVTLKYPGATSQRGDWLTLPLARLALLPSAVAPAVLPAARPVGVPEGPEAGAPRDPKPRDAAYYEAQETRLRALKRLRDENLLTEAEYQQKRRDVLQGL